MGFLKSIASEEQFSFGSIWQYREDSPVAVLPILRDDELERDYILLSEAEKIKIVDTGMIDKVTITSFESKPIYIRMAELFVGKTQERMAVRSYIVMPGSTISVDVRCVHASRGIQTEADMTSGGIASSELDRQIYSKMSVETKVEQGEVWNTVRDVSVEISKSASSLSNRNSTSTSTSSSTSVIATDDLRANLDMFSELLKEVLEEAPHIENQVGMALHDKDRVMGIEVFNQKDSWEAIRDAIITKEGMNITEVEEDEVFGFSDDVVIKNVKNVLKADYEEKVIFESSDYKVIGLISDDYVGEVIELKGQVFHLSLLSTYINEPVMKEPPVNE